VKPSGLALELRLNLIDLQGLMAILQLSAVLPNGSNRLSFTRLIIASEAFLARDQFKTTQSRSRACLRTTLYSAIQSCLQARPGEATIGGPMDFVAQGSVTAALAANSFLSSVLASVSSL
jgi:hypothetical protein